MFELILSLAALAFAVSLDGFAVGIAYGLRQIKIPFISIIIISCCSGVLIWLSMQAGNVLSLILTPWVANAIGAFILIGIGSWSLLQHVREQSSPHNPDKLRTSNEPFSTGHDDSSPAVNPKQVLTLEMKRLGLVIQILRTPQVADVDRSGNISAKEAVMLGTALSLDALGAGIGAAMLGLPTLMTAISIGLCSALLLFAGLQIGARMIGRKQMKWVAILPGIILIIIGIFRLF